jgi:hypothetical protein
MIVLFENKIWGGRWESNPRMPEPQSGVLTTSPRPPYLPQLGKYDYIRFQTFCKVIF